MDYFIFRNGQEHGPYPVLILQGFLKEGSVQLNDLARRSDMTEWRPLGVLLQQPASRASIPSQRHTGNAITWPFSQKNWLQSLWMVFFWWLPLVPLTQFLITGWSLDVIRRKSRHESELLPQSSEWATFLKEGAIVFCMYFVYYVIPVTLIVWITAFNAKGIVLQTIVWGWDYYRGLHPTQSLGGYLWRQFLILFLRAEGPAIYLALASPLFMVARVRFAVTRNPSSFLIHRNLVLMFKHFGDVLAAIFLISLTKFVIGVLAVILSFTVVGLIVLVAAQIWIVAYLLGDLAAKFEDKKALNQMQKQT